MRLSGAYDEIEMRDQVKEALAHALGHAAHDAEDESWALLLEALEDAELANRLEFGLLPNAASVGDTDFSRSMKA